jgi:BCD family chlorophyll transporter-like MFS transporter
MKDFGWLRIARLGLVQAALGSVVVLTTSTINRVMVVELALPALLPGVLVALHYLVQMARPRMGHGSDVGGRRTPWIVGGMALLALGGVTAALGTALVESHRAGGVAVAFVAFVMIGLGVSASGTSLLVMLAKNVAEARRGPAATLVWMMMIMGFAVTAGVAGSLLDPYSPERLVAVSAAVSALAMLVTVVAVWGLEGKTDSTSSISEQASQSPPRAQPAFRDALKEVWSEPVARHFTQFVFISMLAYSAQDLILEPFAGTVFGFTPGASTKLSGVQHGGVLLGMLLVAGAGLLGARAKPGARWKNCGSLRGWTVGGCIGSAMAMAGLTLGGLVGAQWPLQINVFLLGAANGAFSIGAIGSMMKLAAQGRESREGVRMGLWGAAQAIAFGIGGLLGTAASDLAHWLIAAPGPAYASVFALEGVMFLVSAAMAWRIGMAAPAQPASQPAGRTALPNGNDSVAAPT